MPERFDLLVHRDGGGNYGRCRLQMIYLDEIDLLGIVFESLKVICVLSVQELRITSARKQRALKGLSH